MMTDAGGGVSFVGASRRGRRWSDMELPLWKVRSAGVIDVATSLALTFTSNVCRTFQTFARFETRLLNV